MATLSPGKDASERTTSNVSFSVLAANNICIVSKQNHWLCQRLLIKSFDHGLP